MTKPGHKRILIRTAVLAAVGFLVLANASTSGDSSEANSEKALCLRERALNLHQPSAHADVKFIYEKRRSYRGFASKNAAALSKQAVLAVAEDLKKRIAFPFDVQVVFEECGGPDSFYDQDTHKITICDELIDAYYHLFARALRTRTARDTAAKGVIVSMFLHEVAHALIDGWDLPIAGREEDAADQFSTLLLVSGIPDGDTMALDSARSFKLLADLERNQEKDYSDLHSLDEQRFFNTICLVYGHRPERYEYLITNGTLPPEMAIECEQYYARVNKSWQTLLTHFTRSDDQHSASGHSSSQVVGKVNKYLAIGND